MKSYLEQRREQKLGIKPTKQEEKTAKKETGEFFKKSIEQAPKCCENCGRNLRGTMAINPAAVVAHILAKRKTYGVPSMAKNPLNRVYLCGNCHNGFDTIGEKFVVKMKIYPLLLKRVAVMWPHIAENEKKNVPEYLKPKNLLKP